ncbi:RHS repeat-associated core domain-containing protein [Streptomyces sp. YIM 98790]|uniref:RHS repeat-associated core domain-containing protein n=1 Tax=Streptomyces sp. YIM 98790 TaxID=2689077 RepID=UPI00140ABDDC|nr:RHS repeat-associated core domain-containing protein [Streptomyces sp. YIM 98790]
MQNKKWWQKAVDWVVDNWDTIVNVCKIIVAVVGIIAMIIGGPLALLVLAAALIVLADTLIKYANGEASLWDVAFAALDCIPGMKGLTTAAGLLKGIKSGMKALATGARGLGRKFRQQAVKFLKRNGCGDPVDLATGELLMSGVDAELPGVLPLVIERHHVSGYCDGRYFGPSWTSTLDQRLQLGHDEVRFFTDDGMVLLYPVPLPDPGHPVMPVEGPRWGLSWDGRPGGPLTVHQPETGRTLRFSPVPGRPGHELPVTAITDRNANRIDFHYTEHGDPFEVSHSGGYRIGVAVYDDRVTSLRLVSDPEEPVLVTYDYDAAGNLARIYNNSGLPLVLDYDDHSRVVRWEDRTGGWYRYAYDDAGRCVFTTGTGRALEYRYHYDTENNRTTAVNSLGHATVYQFNDSFQLIAETDPLGNTTRREWDRYDRPAAVTDPLGRTTRYAYDDAGNLAVLIRPDGHRIRCEYNDLGLLTSYTAADGATWEQAYDSRGNRTVLKDPAGNTFRYTYDPHGGLETLTDPLGGTTRVRCDAAGLPLAVTDPLGETTRHRRDTFGQVTALIDPLGAETRTEWTPGGRPLRRVDPLGGTETWEWDEDGNLLAHTDAGGGTTRYTYGPFGQPASQTGPDGVTYTFARDTELNLLAVTDPAGRTWRYDYDAAGRIVAETDFDGRTTVWTRDPAGRVTTRRTPAGQTLSYLYDPLDRLIRRAGSDGTVTEYGYDPAGRVVRATSPGVELSRTYDVLGNLTAETVNGRTLSLRHDPLDRLTLRVTPSGHTSAWDYDPAGRPRTLTTGGHTLAFDHDPAGRETSRVIDGRLVHTHTWDPAGRLTAELLAPAQPPVPAAAAAARRHGPALHRRGYAYRADGTPSSVTDETGTTDYTLDPLGRVTQASSPHGRETYTYDDCGNQRTAHWTGAGGAVPDAAGEREYSGTLLTRAGSTRYVHDAAGRTVMRQRVRLSRKPETWRYTWDSDSRLVQVVTPDGTRWRYRYDAFGRRTAKERLTADGEAVAERTVFTWHASTMVEQSTELTGDDGAAPAGPAGPVTLTWDHRGLYPLVQSEHRPAGGTTDGGGRDETDRRFYAIVTDLVGAPVRLVDPSGETAWQGTSTLWGSVRHTGPAGTPLRFPGQYADPETGWHYNYHRHYDPATGRYATSDPLGLEPAPNPYTYPRNPLAWADPLGLEQEWVDAGEINFSQRTISPNDYAEQMRNNQWDWDRSGPLRVMERDGQLVTYDNRRLDAAREAGVRVPIERVDPNAPFPDSSTGKTWEEKFQQRFRDPRNRRAGGVVPNTGLSERPGPPCPQGGRR